MHNLKKSVIVAMLAALCSAAWSISPEELLLQAAENKDMDKLKVALIQGADPNCTDADGFSALLHACKKEWNEGVVCLLENGVNVNVNNKDGKTALMYAVSHANTMNVRRLIEWGANINARDLERKTVLMYAIESKNDRVVDFLLRVGADLSATDMHGNSVALYAVKHKNMMLLKELVRTPAINWNETNNEGISPFALACMDEDLNIVNQLLQEAPIDVSVCSIDGQPIIIWLIAHRKSARTIEYLMEFCNPEKIRLMTDYEGHDIKYWAEKQGYERVIMRLYEIEKEGFAVKRAR